MFFVLFIVLLGGIVLFYVILLLWKLRPSKSHGDAKFGEWPGVTAPSLKHLPPGLVIGRTPNNHIAGWNQEGHWLVMAPTGAGKTTGVLMPSIVNWQGSLAAIDIKGELARECSPILQANGINCVRIDPFGVLDDTAIPKVGINPITEAKEAADAIESSKTLAEILIDPGHGSGDHWAQSARTLTAALAYTAMHNLEFAADLNWLLTAATELPAVPVFENMPTHAHVEIVANAKSLLDNAGKNELGAILSTVRRQLTFLTNPQVAEVFRGEWRSSQLLDANNPAAVFIILPPEYLSSQGRMLRVVIGTIAKAMLAAGVSRSRRLLFVLDETAALDHLEIVSQGISLYRGFGATFLLAFQDLGQLEATYGNEHSRSILANCNSAYWASNDQATCEALATMLGQQTVLAGSRKLDDIPLSVTGASQLREVGRDLLSPDEVRRLPKDELIALLAGHRPVKLQLLKPGCHKN